MERESYGKWVKSVLMVVLSGTMLVSTTGCDESDVAAGIIIGGVIGGVIGAIDDDDGHNHRRRYCKVRRVRECRTQYDYYGDPYEECRRVRKKICRHRPFSNSLASTSSSSVLEAFNVKVADNSVSSETADVANQLELSFDGAEKLVNALKLAQKGEINALADLGINMKAIEKIGKLKMPSDGSIDKLAQALNIQPNKAEELVSEFIAEAKDQMKDVNSAAWQSCLSASSWKTPQNYFCKKTYWTGCSPQTGASLCVPNL